MSDADARTFLTQSIADRKLSGSERAALGDWLRANARTDQQRGVVRHLAFELAREASPDADADQVIGWLEDVLKVICPVMPAADAPRPVNGGPVEVAFSPGEACLRLIAGRFAAARKSADVCVFTVTDDRICRAVLDAHRRGVKVRVIADREKTYDPGSDIHKFAEAGVPVKLDDAAGPVGPGAGSGGHMHHKFALFDGVRLLTGSYNWTRGAAESNYENVIDTGDPVLVAAFAGEFARLWARF